MSRNVCGSSFMRRRNRREGEGSRSWGHLRMRGKGLSSSYRLRELNVNTTRDRSSSSMKVLCRERLSKRNRRLGSIKCKNKLNSSMNSAWLERQRSKGSSKLRTRWEKVTTWWTCCVRQRCKSSTFATEGRKNSMRGRLTAFQMGEWLPLTTEVTITQLSMGLLRA